MSALPAPPRPCRRRRAPSSPAAGVARAGKHKRAQFADACICVFLFDVLHLNGHSLVDLPLVTRRRVLDLIVTEVPNRVHVSELQSVKSARELRTLMAQVPVRAYAALPPLTALLGVAQAMALGLEGLMIKSARGAYEPGRRHWCACAPWLSVRRTERRACAG